MRDPFIESIEKLLLRDLAQLEKELEMYPDESSVWKTTGAISNSAGNLTLHLIGNLRYFIGTQLGKTGYERDRPAEFSSRDVPRATLIESIHVTKTDILQGLAAVDASRLQQRYPENPFHQQGGTVQHMLMHLCVHLGYHLGQVNYHRRLVATQKSS
ncbi:MAG: DUF1572 family protein [Cyclobacteriaceae bacterium]